MDWPSPNLRRKTGLLLICHVLLGFVGGWAAEAGKAPIPAQEKVKEAEATIRDLFKAEFAKRAPADQAALAGKLLAQSDDARNDPLAFYQLLVMARDLAVQQGEVKIAVQALERLGSRFWVDAVALKEAALNALKQTARTRDQQVDLARAYLELAEAAARASSFDLALSAAEDAQRFARTVQDKDLTAAGQEKARTLGNQKRAYDQIAKEREKLLTNPDDPAANAAVGKFYFVKRFNWEMGLQLLAKGNDAAWAPLAQADLKNPTEVKDVLDVADRWWELADKLPKDEQESPRFRAALLYNKIAATVAGLSKIKIEQRLKQIDIGKLSALTQGAGEAIQASAAPVAPDAPAAGGANSVLVTQEELKELLALGEAGRKGDADKNSKLSHKRWELHRRLAQDPKTWTPDDLKARVNSELELNKTYDRAMNASYYDVYEVMRAWPQYAETAKTNAEFLARLKELPHLIRRYNLMKPMQSENENLREGLRLYFEANAQLFATKAAKSQFCQFLKDNGVDKGVLDAFMAEQK